MATATATTVSLPDNMQDSEAAGSSETIGHGRNGGDGEGHAGSAEVSGKTGETGCTNEGTNGPSGDYRGTGGRHECGRSIYTIFAEGRDYEVIVQPFPDAQALALVGQGDEKATMLFLRAGWIKEDITALANVCGLTPLLPLFLDSVPKA